MTPGSTATLRRYDRLREGPDAKLMPDGYRARVEQVILFIVSAWNENCSQHIPQRFEAADVVAALAERDQRIEMLEAELKELRKTNGKAGDGMAGA